MLSHLLDLFSLDLFLSVLLRAVKPEDFPDGVRATMPRGVISSHSVFRSKFATENAKPGNASGRAGIEVENT